MRFVCGSPEILVKKKLTETRTLIFNLAYIKGNIQENSGERLQHHPQNIHTINQFGVLDLMIT